MTQSWTLETELASLKLPLNLYKLSQSEVGGYDSCVVVAHSEETAKLIYPGGGTLGSNHDWCNDSQIDLITSELLGVLDSDSSYKHGDVICSSYNVG